MANSQKCSNCGGKDHIAKFCYERTKKVPATVKLSTQSDKMNSKDKKELKLQKKEQEIVVQVTKQTPKSKYEEDKYIGQHTQIWGSYWNEVLGWGFACCYSNQKSQECLGEKGKRQSLTKEYSIKRQIEETPIAQQELKSGPLNLDELYRKSNLREGAPVDVIYNQSNTTN
ncbi:unnamed protein product (macronuclear) [Paramecium tetraurelia]|uniref:Pre-mRNA-splicing factor SLU7 n=1 Tax=Paramecium tetraurelia TaxID=5888 RepID=A0E1S9_PARTE|nr:uncharacterized protein GSPATT00022417001 [Paramecium tetraurelia]CAK89246.1 unnamed protein product [Paramecium tetraurelia]|eukprot:XP_001456643.1 hypothetical protein (macronuclear) [Paramecium tetraurelia strain d4-2]